MIEIKMALIAILLKYKIVQTPETEVRADLQNYALLLAHCKYFSADV